MRHLPSLRRVVAAGAAALTLGALVAPTTAAAPGQSQTATGDPSSKITSGPTLSDGTQADAVENRWFVELASPSVAAGGSSDTVRAEQDDFASAVRDAGIDARVTTEYGTLWNGVAVSVGSDADVESLAGLAQVVSLQPVIYIPAPDADPAGGADANDAGQAPVQEGEEGQEQVTTPQMRNALGMTGADVAQSKLGYTGEGIKIGIIDSGIDYDHVEFGGSGTPGPEPAEGDGSTNFPDSKVVAGHDFVGNAFGDPAADATTRLTPAPDDYPDDCWGHGTHVAGIAAAKGAPGTDQITGVAPDAQLGAYRVFGCTGGTTSEILASAMERAADDGMDVVNMSVGADFVVFRDYPTAVAAENLASKGVIVTAAQGNQGEYGRWTMGAPASAEHVLSVGSVDNTVETDFYLTVSTNPGQKYLYSEIPGSTAPISRDNGTRAPLVASGDPAADGGDETTDASVLCTAPAAGAYTGRTVLVRRGACAFRDKALNAQAGGAAGIVIDDNQPGAIPPFSVSGDGDPVTIPVAGISQADGDAIRGALDADSTLTYREDAAEFDQATGGLVSSFSSWGLNDSLQLKPDVVAPGGRIWSTWPLDHDGPYRTEAGASMAAPYTAGASALVLQAHPEIKDASGFDAFDQVAWRLHSTADPVPWAAGAGDADAREPLAREGAGLIDVDGAITASTETSSSVLNIGEVEQHPDGYRASVTLTNHSDSSATYALSHEDAVTVTGASSTPQQGTDSPSTVSTDGQSITVPAGGTATVDATITAPAGLADGDFFGGWIVLTDSSAAADSPQAEPVRVPFQGVGGNLARASVFGPQIGLADLDGQSIDPASYVYGDSARSDQGAYTDSPVVAISHPDVPYYRSALTVSRVNADGTTEYLGTAVTDEKEHTRNDTVYMVWDGSYTVDGRILQAPTGQYQLTVRALPVGGDGDEDADWAEWTSPTFSIDWKTDGYIPQSELSVASPDGAAALTDDNIFTPVEASSTEASYDIDLGGVYDVDAIHYTPVRYDSALHATRWTVQTSTDGAAWTDAASGDIDPTSFNPTILELDAPVRARYVRVVITNGQDGATSLGVAELRVAGTAAGGSDDPTADPSGPAAADPDQADSGRPDPGDAGAGDAGAGDAGGSPVAADVDASVASQSTGHGSGALARTGASIGLGVVAIVLVVGGVLLVRRRRG